MRDTHNIGLAVIQRSPAAICCGPQFRELSHTRGIHAYPGVFTILLSSREQCSIGYADWDKETSNRLSGDGITY
jgi:hypothetical protein